MNTNEVIIENLNEELAEAHRRILELEGQVQWYVDKVAEGHFGGPGLKGYRELGEKLSTMHDQYDKVVAELSMAKGIISSDDKRLSDAAIRVWGEHLWGCDTAEHLADTILNLRNYLRERVYNHVTAVEQRLAEEVEAHQKTAKQLADTLTYVKHLEEDR